MKERVNGIAPGILVIWNIGKARGYLYEKISFVGRGGGVLLVLLLEMYPHSSALLNLLAVKIFVSSQIGALQASWHSMKCDLINDVKQIYSTVANF